MRKAIGIVMVAGVCCLLAATALAQQKPVHFKQLQGFLPKIDIAGFTKGKPGGQTSTAMGMSTSEATLEYTKGEETIEVKISDMAGVPFAAVGASMMGMTEFENQTENGYEKSVKIQGFPGTEKVETGEYKSAEISLVVANRFMVELKGNGMSDAAILRKLIDSMNLAELAKQTAQ
jgi:hypothetical protein